MQWLAAVKKVVLALISGMVIAACGGSTANTSSSPAPVSFAMTAQNGSGVSGTGSIVESAASFTVTIKLTGMMPSSTHVSHIHAGHCAAPGGIAFNLQQVVADTSGAATMTTTVPAAYVVPASGWYVNVHFGPDISQAAYAPSISCGDLGAA